MSIFQQYLELKHEDLRNPLPLECNKVFAILRTANGKNVDLYLDIPHNGNSSFPTYADLKETLNIHYCRELFNTYLEKSEKIAVYQDIQDMSIMHDVLILNFEMQEQTIEARLTQIAMDTIQGIHIAKETRNERYFDMMQRMMLEVLAKSPPDTAEKFLQRTEFEKFLPSGTPKWDHRTAIEIHQRNLAALL